MKHADHIALLDGRDYTPRVVERWNARDRAMNYYAWSPTWEGPLRPDYAAANADLQDFLRDGIRYR